MLASCLSVLYSAFFSPFFFMHFLTLSLFCEAWSLWSVCYDWHDTLVVKVTFFFREWQFAFHDIAVFTKSTPLSPIYLLISFSFLFSWTELALLFFSKYVYSSTVSRSGVFFLITIYLLSCPLTFRSPLKTLFFWRVTEDSAVLITTYQLRLKRNSLKSIKWSSGDNMNEARIAPL